MEATVAELRAALASYLKRVKAGEEVVVTERGRPVARLVPATADAALDELYRSGALVPPAREPDAAWLAEFWALPRASDRDDFVLKAMLEEREEAP